MQFCFIYRSVRIAIMIAAFCALTSGAANSAQMPKSLSPLIKQKSQIAGELAATIANCVSRTDTNHIVFRGCIDWHSSVHGHWALIAYQLATGDSRYAKIVRAGLNAADLKRETRYLQRRRGFEMPYGRAWFLRLAIDHRRLTGEATLTPMADYVMQTLFRYYRRNSIDPRSSSYDSASWALINMHAYAKQRGDQHALLIIEGWIHKRFVQGAPRCNYRWEGTGFMAVCTNWAWLVAKVLPKDELKVWLETFFRRSGLPAPVRNPRRWHHYGLNFSRAWGLWAVYEATGERKFADAYAEHFRAGYKPSSNWRGNYNGVGHWVAQFGMFAFQPIFGSSRGR